MTDPLQLAALHEAAHAVVAVRLGVQVTAASIRPRRWPGDTVDTPGQRSVPCIKRHPDPRPEDCSAQSFWFQSWAMVTLAGEVLEEVLDDSGGFFQGVPDHRRVLDLLREFGPTIPDLAVQRLDRLRSETREILTLQESLAEVNAAADLLLERGEVTGDVFYRSLYRNCCSAFHPQLPDVQCDAIPHPYGEHFGWSEHAPEGFVVWKGLPAPPVTQRVGSMTAAHKRIRSVNRGEPPRPLTKSWRRALDRDADFLRMLARDAE